MMGKKRVLIWVRNWIDFIRVRIDSLSFLLRQTALKIEKSVSDKEFQEEIDRMTESPDEFLDLPNALSETISQENDKYREQARLYFLLKQISALYEAEVKALSIQVFNELRNALDHFYRSLVDFGGENGNEEDGQLRKVSAHLQRAIFDVSKLLCAHYSDYVNDRVNKAGVKILGLVSDGDFLKELYRRREVAGRKYVEARLSDLQIRAEDESADVIRQYLDAVIEHKNYYDFYRESAHKVHFARWRRYAFGASFLFLGLAFKPVYDLSIGVAGEIVAPIVDEHVGDIGLLFDQAEDVSQVERKGGG